MDWDTQTPSLPDLAESDIPAELLDGLECWSVDCKLLAIRFRWRPHQTTATGFLTKNRLRSLEGHTSLEIAHAVTSYATHLYESGECESKFEAQLRRELEEPGADGSQREWRSITFYLNTEDSKADNMSAGFNDSEDLGMGGYEPARSAVPTAPAGYNDYAGFVELSRSDPTAFAMLVTQQSNDRVVTILERLLFSSVGRLDGILSRQVSSSRYVNEALQTLTRGASDIAGVGVNLFQQGLEGQARVARMEHETEVGKDRTELMRDTVKQGSLLMQAVLMSNAAKRNQGRAAAPPPAEAGPRARPYPSTDDNPPSPPPTEPAASDDASSEADRDIVERARRLLALVTDELCDEVRGVAPSLVAVFEELRERPLTATVVREIIHGAQTTVDQLEFAKAGELVDSSIADAFAGLIMRVYSEGM